MIANLRYQKNRDLIRGEVIWREPLDGFAGVASSHLIHELSQHFLMTRGERGCFAAETGFILQRNPDTVRGLSLAYVPNQKRNDNDNRDFFLTSMPSLIVRTLSSQSTEEVNEEITDWLHFGVDQVYTQFQIKIADRPHDIA